MTTTLTLLAVGIAVAGFGCLAAVLHLDAFLVRLTDCTIGSCGLGLPAGRLTDAGHFDWHPTAW